MNCQEIENKILDYQEDRLSSAQRQEMESHLTACAGCRRFSRQLRQLDAALLAAVKVPVLSAGFERRLRERIEAVPQGTSAAQRAERKRQLQAEFDAGLARITRQSFALATLLEHLSRPMLAILTAGLAWSFMLSLLSHLNIHVSGSLISNLLPVLAASAVFLVVCLTDRSLRHRNSLGM